MAAADRCTTKVPHTVRGRTLVALLLLGVSLALGCGPANLAMFLVPFVDNKVKPECPLAVSGKEVSVAVIVTFADREARERPEVAPADHELAGLLAQQLRKRSQDNKEKIKIVPGTQVRSYLSKQGRLGVVDPARVGKHFKADRVVTVEIGRMALYQPNTFPRMLRGNADLTVCVYDLSKPEGEQKVFEKPYTREYPKSRPVDEGSGSGSVPQFRALFLMKVATDLTRMFTAFDPDDLRRLD